MSNRGLVLLLLFWFGFQILSCVPEPILTISVDLDLFGFAGGSGKLTLSANNEWSVSSSESWLKVVDEQGTASEKATARFTVAANDTPNKRTATITVSSSTLTQAITITQEQHDRISVEGPQAVGPQENTIVFTVSTNATYTIDVAEGSSWITHVDSKALDQHYESFSITANDTYGDRNGRIVFRTPGGEVAVADFLQSQNDAAFLEGQADYTFDYHGGSLTISAKSNVGCTAHIIQGGEWIHAQNTKALVDYAFSFSLDENPTFEDRTGIIRLETAGGDAVDEVTVLQTKNTEPYLTVQTDEIQMEPQEGVAEIALSSNAGIKLLPPDVKWIDASLEEEYSSNITTEETVLHIEVKENLGYWRRQTTLVLQTLEGSLEARIQVIQDEYKGLHQFCYWLYGTSATAPLIGSSDDVFGIIDWGDSNLERYAPGLEHSYTPNGDTPFRVVIRVTDVDEVTFPSIGGISEFDFSVL